MSRKKFNILLLSSGGPGAKGVIESFQKSRLKNFDFSFIGMDANSDAINQSLLDSFYVSPKRKERESFLSLIDKVFEKEKVDLIYPLSSDDIVFLLENESSLGEKIKKSVLVFDNDYSSLTDKFLTYSLAKNKKYCPDFFVSKRENWEGIVSKNTSDVLYAKPRKGSGARANFLLKKKIEMSDFLSKKGSNVMDYDSFFRIAGNIEDFVFCEFLPGKEYSIDIFSDKGDLLSTCIRVRKEVRSGVSSVAVVENNREVIEMIESITRDFALDGACNIQLKRNFNKDLKLVEINPRTSGTICVSCNAGVNIVELCLRKHLGLEFRNVYPFLSKEIKMIRHSEETYFND